MQDVAFRERLVASLAQQASISLALARERVKARSVLHANNIGVLAAAHPFKLMVRLVAVFHRAADRSRTKIYNDYAT
jgi:hypothetical protein